MFHGFHPFGHGLVPQLMGQPDGCADDGQIVRMGAERMHERFVDFQVVDGKVPQIAQRGIAGAEVIDRALRAAAAQGLELLFGALRVAHHRAFGDLEGHAIEPQPFLGKAVCQSVHQVGAVELPRREVDADAPRLCGGQQPLFAPAPALPGHLLADPKAQMFDQVRLFRDGDELVGWDVTTIALRPAQQRFEAQEGEAVAEAVNGLVVQFELMGLQRGAQPVLELDAPDDRLVHVGGVEAVARAPFIFDVVHGQIGQTQQLVFLQPVLWIQRNANGGRQVHGPAWGVVGRAEGLQQLRSHLGRIQAGFDAGEGNDEFVTTDAGHEVALAQPFAQPTRHLDQHHVAHFVTE